MATRSTISLEFADGTVGQVYCHWDGYLEHNGKMLQEYYTDPFKLQKLIDLGDLSSLARDIGTRHDFADQIPYECTFYGRDRGDKGCKARYFKTYDDFVENGQSEEYNYILRTDGKWYVDSDKGFVPLTSVMKDKALG